jgi:hypothetical protein
MHPIPYKRGNLLSPGFRTLYLIFSIIAFSCIPAFTQPESWEVHQYTTADGLSSNYVNCVYRDSRGFIWLGTGNGLNRFDAYTFTQPELASGELYMPAVMEELNYKYGSTTADEMPRLVQKVFNLDKEEERVDFFRDYSKTLPIPGTHRTISYDPVPRLALATSKLGASEAISLGAYAYALQQIED